MDRLCRGHGGCVIELVQSKASWTRPPILNAPPVLLASPKRGKPNPMRALFIGGTGIISSACSQLALDLGIELYLLNRGTSHQETPKGAKVLTGNIRDHTAEEALKGLEFDAVVDWVAFTGEHIQRDIQLFEGKTKQFVFISSASAYQTPPNWLPVTESAMLENPFWEYSRNKIKCEELLVNAYRKSKFPATIIRPSHTYDKTLLPFDHGWTVVDRMRKESRLLSTGMEVRCGHSPTTKTSPRDSCHC